MFIWLFRDNVNVNLTNGSGNSPAVIQLEKEVLQPLAGTGAAYVYPTTNWWSQLKTAGSAIYANRHYLQLYKKFHSDRLYNNKLNSHKPYIIDDVYIHPTARVHDSAVVSIDLSLFTFNLFY